MFTRVKMSTKEEIHRGVYASVVRTGKLRATRERMLMLQGLVKFQVMILLYSAADVNYFSTRKLINRHRPGGKKMLFDFLHLFGFLEWR